MTVLYAQNKIKNKKRDAELAVKSLLLFLISALASVYISSYILEYVKTGMRLCYSAVIGSVFPFMVLTDLLYSHGNPSNIAAVKYIFEKAFKINGNASVAFIIGIICGFPLGVKIAIQLYKDGCISKNECERLIGFSNNTGPAFIISGIGAAMRGSIYHGIILYVSMVLSAIAVGIIGGIGKDFTSTIPQEEQRKFNITESIKSAGINTLNISSFVIFFSVVCGILNLFIKNEIVISFILPFLEISNAAKRLSTTSSIPHEITLLLTSFAVSFSGISVHLQAKNFIYGTDISMKKYYLSKLLQGLFSVFFTLIFILIKIS